MRSQNLRCWLSQGGYRLSVISLKQSAKVYAPLTDGLKEPFSGDANLPVNRISNLDKLYLGVSATPGPVAAGT